jgi:hypothetical protein
VEFLIGFTLYEVEGVGNDRAGFDLYEDILGSRSRLFDRTEFERLVGADHASDFDRGHCGDIFSPSVWPFMLERRA